ncbi:MAG: hypothetical protein ORN85_08020 [Sediminibacterium sp.]|nr:hypothetical protein [Sediminibacterium sp.]
MANIVVTPESEQAFQETLSYLFSTRKTKADILLEGKLEGKLEGEYQKARETAKKIKAKGMSLAFIQDVTSLSIDEIEKL